MGRKGQEGGEEDNFAETKFSDSLNRIFELTFLALQFSWKPVGNKHPNVIEILTIMAGIFGRGLGGRTLALAIARSSLRRRRSHAFTLHHTRHLHPHLRERLNELVYRSRSILEKVFHRRQRERRLKFAQENCRLTKTVVGNMKCGIVPLGHLIFVKELCVVPCMSSLSCFKHTDTKFWEMFSISGSRHVSSWGFCTIWRTIKFKNCLQQTCPRVSVSMHAHNNINTENYWK